MTFVLSREQNRTWLITSTVLAKVYINFCLLSSKCIVVITCKFNKLPAVHPRTLHHIKQGYLIETLTKFYRDREVLAK